MDESADIRGIAIIGMACRFPGANNPEEFWQNLRDGVDSIRHFNDAELLRAGVSERQLKRDDYVKASPVVDGFDLFDAPFFEYSPKEAKLMDPQQRLALEEAWHSRTPLFRSQFACGNDNRVPGLVFQRDVLACVIFKGLSKVGDRNLDLFSTLAFGKDVERVAFEFLVVHPRGDKVITRCPVRCDFEGFGPDEHHGIVAFAHFALIGRGNTGDQIARTVGLDQGLVVHDTLDLASEHVVFTHE